MRRLENPIELISSFEKNKHRVFTCAAYFSSKPDPQLKAYLHPDARARDNDITYLSTWMATSLFYNMVPVILLDEPNFGIIESLTSKGAIIIRCELGDMSTNDERFYYYKQLTTLLPECFFAFTDISDVIFKRCLFDLLVENPNLLFMGKDISRTPFIKDNKWVLKKIQFLIKQKPTIFAKIELKKFLNSSLVNAGTLAGKGILLEQYLKKITTFLNECPNEGNWNMIAFNYAYMLSDESMIKVGAPFTSDFKTYNYEFSGYIVHK